MLCCFIQVVLFYPCGAVLFCFLMCLFFYFKDVLEMGFFFSFFFSFFFLFQEEGKRGIDLVYCVLSSMEKGKRVVGKERGVGCMLGLRLFA